MVALAFELGVPDPSDAGVRLTTVVFTAIWRGAGLVGEAVGAGEGTGGLGVAVFTGSDAGGFGLASWFGLDGVGFGGSGFCAKGG